MNAEFVFSNLHELDLKSWNAMLILEGHGRKTLQLYARMLVEHMTACICVSCKRVATRGPLILCIQIHKYLLCTHHLLSLVLQTLSLSGMGNVEGWKTLRKSSTPCSNLMWCHLLLPMPDKETSRQVSSVINKRGWKV